MLLIAIALVAFKKTPYVEARELGLIDTILQILITLDLSIVTLVFYDLIGFISPVKKCFVWIGGISYELYLGHVLLLDYLKRNANISNLMIFIAGTVAITIWIIIFERLMKIRRS